MFIDASAIVAILAREPDHVSLRERINEHLGPIYTSAIARLEAVLALSRVKFPNQQRSLDQFRTVSDTVDRFLAEIGAIEVDIQGETGRRAIAAAATYGKAVGHPAALNLGDCFAYACAKTLRVPLLYKGNDFAQTDLA